MKDKDKVLETEVATPEADASAGTNQEETEKERIAMLQDLMFHRQIKGKHAAGRAQKPKDYTKKRKNRNRMQRHARINNR